MSSPAFDDTTRRMWRDNVLFSALVELTYRCNLDCFFCYNDTGLKGTPLTNAQYFRFFEDLCGLGTMNLTLTGGEPLAHPGFFALGAKARELGFLVRVKSNGHALRGRMLQRLLEEVDPFMVEMSLHGASAASHDRQTRVPGSFVRLIDNVRAARAAGLRIRLNSPLTVWNEHEIEAMFALTDELGVMFQFDPLITRRDNGDPSPFEVAPSPAAIGRLFEIQQRRAAAHDVGSEHEPESADSVAGEHASGKQCGAGSASITVDPFGNVYPCVQWRRRIGNLHDQDIGTIWKHSDELEKVRNVAQEVKRTVQDRGMTSIAFCPGAAEQETGSPLRVYPAAQVMLDLRRSAARKLQTT